MRRAGWVTAILIAASSVAGAAAWQGPPPSPAPQPLPAEVKLDRFTEMMTEQWAWRLEMFPDAVMPEISIVEEWTDDNWDTTIAQCYRDAGFTIRGSYERGWSSRSPANVDSAVAAVAAFECDTSFPWEGALDSLMSDAELNATYDYYMRQLSPCLALVGAPPAVDAPARDEIVDDSGRFLEWSPYSFGSVEVEEEDRNRWERLCPSEPPWQRSPS